MSFNNLPIYSTQQTTPKSWKYAPKAASVLRQPITKSSNNPAEHWRAILSEFLGTTAFLFLCFSTRLLGDDATGGLRNAFICGNALTALIFALGHVSGCHVNPAITLCLMIVRALPAGIGLLYTAAQLLGSVAASILFYCLRSDQNFLPTPEEVGFRDTSLIRLSSFMFQCFITGFLLWIVLATGVDSKGTEARNKMAPIPIGLAVGVGVAVSGKFVGATMNPAGAFGDLMFSQASFMHWLLHFFTPLVPAFIVGIVYKLVFMTRSDGLLSADAPQTRASMASSIKTCQVNF